MSAPTSVPWASSSARSRRLSVLCQANSLLASRLNPSRTAMISRRHSLAPNSKSSTAYKGQQIPPQKGNRSTSRSPSLNIMAGYIILVLDTNVVLSSLSAIASIIESLQWTIVIPVPVIMELDSLSPNPSHDGETTTTTTGRNRDGVATPSRLPTVSSHFFTI